MKTVSSIKVSVEWAEMMIKWKENKKPSQIAASFTNVLQLEEKHLTHFKGAPYLWKPMNGNVFGGMLMDDSLDYVHLVLVSEDVLDYILKLQ